MPHAPAAARLARRHPLARLAAGCCGLALALAAPAAFAQTFAARTDHLTGGYPGGVALGDVNGDSRLDVVTANIIGGTVSVLLAGPTGGFSPKTDYNGGAALYSVALGDGDGRLDIVAANSNWNTVSVLLGRPGGFGPAPNTPWGRPPRASPWATLPATAAWMW